MRDLLVSKSECYFEPTTTNIVVGVFLILGTISSYIPQYIAIVKSKTSDGINFVMLAIALLSAFLTAINSGVLKWSQVVCCLDLNGVECLKNNLATEQLLAGLFCYVGLYVLFLMYLNTDPTRDETRDQRRRRKTTAIVVLIAIILISVLLATLCGVLYYDAGVEGYAISIMAKVLGGTSSALMIVQWTPQIYTTWKMKSQGALSILMLLIQMPGALLVMFFQAILNSADVTTWAPYAFQFIEQLILTVMCILFNMKKKKQKGQRKSRAEEDSQPLIADDVDAVSISNIYG